MERDTVSMMTMHEDTRSLAKKIVVVTFVLILLDSLYFIANIYEWYVYIAKMRSLQTQDVHAVFYFVIRPIIAIGALLMSLIVYIINYKAYGSILTAIENQEPSMMSKGLKNIFIGFLLIAITFIFALLGTIYETYLLL